MPRVPSNVLPLPPQKGGLDQPTPSPTMFAMAQAMMLGQQKQNLGKDPKGSDGRSNK